MKGNIILGCCRSYHNIILSLIKETDLNLRQNRTPSLSRT